MDSECCCLREKYQWASLIQPSTSDGYHNVIGVANTSLTTTHFATRLFVYRSPPSGYCSFDISDTDNIFGDEDSSGFLNGDVDFALRGKSSEVSEAFIFHNFAARSFVLNFYASNISAILQSSRIQSFTASSLPTTGLQNNTLLNYVSSCPCDALPHCCLCTSNG